MEKCYDCGFERPYLQKHHIIPRSEGGLDDPTNLVSLCANCHEDRHGGPCGGLGRGRLAHSPEAQAKRSKTMKRLWEDPEYRNKTLAAQNASKPKKNYVEIGRKVSAAWTPEKKAAHAERLRELRKTQPERWANADAAASARMKHLWSEQPEQTNQMLHPTHD